MIFTLVLLLVGVFLFPSIKASFSTKSRELPEAIDLNPVRDALIEKQGWSLGRAEAARSEYIRFLTLLQLRPGFMLVPWLNADGQDDLDQFWHQHILDTARYAADCNLLFGHIIHHNPHIARGSGLETDAVTKTQRLYARTFASGTYGRPADTQSLTGCGACGTVELDSTPSGGSHHGGAHGDSGHGCGSHSCGGHGCGNGCGSSCGGH